MKNQIAVLCAMAMIGKETETTESIDISSGKLLGKRTTGQGYKCTTMSHIERYRGQVEGIHWLDDLIQAQVHKSKRLLEDASLSNEKA